MESRLVEFQYTNLYHVINWSIMAVFKFKTAASHLNARNMAQILQSLCYKVCSTLLPKFVAIKSSLPLLDKSAIFNQYLVAML